MSCVLLSSAGGSANYSARGLSVSVSAQDDCLRHPSRQRASKVGIETEAVGQRSVQADRDQPYRLPEHVDRNKAEGFAAGTTLALNDTVDDIKRMIEEARAKRM